MVEGALHTRGFTQGARKTNRCYGDITDTQASSCLFYPTSIITCQKDRGKAGRLHPTQKPVELLRYLIRTYSNEGETVLDNCMGSGSTGVAALSEGRDFIGIERDPYFFETAKTRIESYTRNTTEESK